MAARDWENRPLDGQGEANDEYCFFGECSDPENAEDIDTEGGPGREFVSYMLKLMYQNSISATLFCIIMYLAFKAGISECEPYGLKPGSPSGHYMRKVKRMAGWAKSEEFLYVDVVGQGKHDIERTQMSTATLPAHEQMTEDIEGINASKALLAQRKQQAGGLPQCYYDHPVVRSAAPGEVVLPIATYLDGVPYSLTDAVLGFWVINLLDSRRYLCMILRKRNMCDCGCKGWCTLYFYFTMFRWYLQALARGEHPDKGPFGPWESSGARAMRAGVSFGFKAACLYFKGDWMELAGSVGFPSWADGLRPCFDCNSHSHKMYDPQSSMDVLSWLINADRDYYDACDRCEKLVVVRNAGDAANIVSRLRHDRRKQGSRGRALVADLQIHGVQLLANDRLEPSPVLPDVGSLEQLTDFPKTITFWRPSAETLARHRNPVFDPEIGMTPRRSIVVDLLHALYLGILLVYARLVLWKLIVHGAYGHTGTNHEHLSVAMVVLRSALMTWYPVHEKKTGEVLTRVADLTAGMLGEPGDPKLKTKGAETWGIVLFVVEELKIKGGVLPPDDCTRLLHAGENLVRIARIWKSCDWTVPDDLQKDRLDIDSSLAMETYMVLGQPLSAL